ncbi:hypothetical protein [Streptomyces afghaniensis]|uniref:hypothetical protein n=1 Tax=Streptomyces afghaniensis TaxID=66865 RepID=UPI0027D7ABA5|nr:hypothetical protein [Streptomyces afghaniensis]
MQIPNEIAQSSMSLAELGLLVKLLSLPDKNNATVEKITARVPDGRRTVSNAMNGLVERRYVHRARVQDPETKRWVTLTSVSDTPTDHMPTVGQPTGQAVGGYPKGKDAGRNDLPTPEPEAEPDGFAEGSEGEGEESAPEENPALTQRAVKTLQRLAIHDIRLLLSNRECARLAPLAAEWLAAGFHEMEVIRTLTAGLPAEITSAAALVTFRLKNHQPEHIPAPAPSQAPSGPIQRARCPECDVIFPLGHPGGICRNCR